MYNQILAEEFNGAKVKIIDSSDTKEIGISGIIVMETKNTFVIDTDKGRKIVKKKGNIFMLYKNNKYYIILGHLILLRPKERVEKFVK
ncbi:MAG: ribonuclease P protein component 1 [Candidatus Micrarchaeota archaeon]|nr:MAG: ribonuclease P protein component 1 [Candidatus Micrarchaeota archaeon]